MLHVSDYQTGNQMGVNMSFNNNMLDDESKQLWDKFLEAKKLRDASVTGLRNKLVGKYAHIVRSIAQKIFRKFPPNITVDDLIQSGFLGLIKAIESFDNSISENFIGYASTRIRGSIYDFVRTNDELTRNLRDISTKYTKACENLEKRLFRPPTECEIRDEMGLSQQEYDYFLPLLPKFQTLSIDEDKGSSAEDGFNLLDSVADSDSDDQMLNTFKNEILFESLKNLPLKERAIVALWYKDNLRQNVIAEILGLSEGRISQLRREIKHKLYDASE